MYFWPVSLVLRGWSHQNGTNTSRCTLVANTEVGRPEAWLTRWVSPSGCCLAVLCKTGCLAWAVRLAAPCHFFHWENRRRLLHESGSPQTTGWDLPFVSTSCFQELEEKESPVFTPPPPKVRSCSVMHRLGSSECSWASREKVSPLWLFPPPLRLKLCEDTLLLCRTQKPCCITSAKLMRAVGGTSAVGEGRTRGLC